MKEYFYFYKPWHTKTKEKGRKGGFAFQHIVNLSMKRLLTPKEGFIFIGLMFRRYNRIHSDSQFIYQYERKKNERGF